MKLIITYKGDMSVGIRPQRWAVEVPFEKEEFDVEDLEMNLNAFREDMRKVYEQYCDSDVYCSYDFEIEAEEQAELEMEARHVSDSR